MQTVNPKDYGKVVVLLGGKSGEREISLASGQDVLDALIKLGVNAISLDPIEPDFVQKLLNLKPDLVFNILHGKDGEDGVIPGLLESLDIPYTGSKVSAASLCMDKLRACQVLAANGIVTPEGKLAHDLYEAKKIATKIGFPVAVKPISSGSSIGISKVTKLEQLADAFELAKQHGDVMLERWIIGRDLFVGIIDDLVLPICEVVSSGAEFYDFHAKYQAKDTIYKIPAPLEDAVTKQIQKIAKQSHIALGAHGWSRVDFVLDANNQPYVLEVNTVPGMTSHSLMPKSAKVAGLSFEDLVLRILQSGLTNQASGNLKNNDNNINSSDNQSVSTN